MDFKPDTEQTLTIRPSDYDPLGHVNNAVYFDLLEACIETAYPPETDIRRITMQFNKEIGREIQTVEIGFKANGKNDTQFRIVQNNCIHAAGEMNLISK